MKVVSIKKIKDFLRFYRFAKPYKLGLALILLVSLLTIAISIINPYLLKILIDDAMLQKDMELLVKLLILMVALGLISSAFGFISTYFNGKITGKIMIDIRKAIFNHIIYLPQSYFIKNKIGDIVQKINNEVDNIRDFITSSVLRITKDVLMIVGYIGALCWLNLRLFLLVSITFPLTILVLRYFQPRIKKVLSKIRVKDSEILSFFMEEFSNIKLIQSFNIYQNENLKLSKHLSARFFLGMRRIRLKAVNTSVMGLVFSLTMTLLFSYGGLLIINETLTIGALLAFINYLLYLSDPIKDLQNLYMEIARVSVSMDRLNEIMETPTILDIESSEPFLFKEKLRFQNVNFKYKKTNVLNNLNLTIEKGKCYAIAGSSGNGKSTLINLILRFFEPTEGNIFIDNVLINRINIFDLRENICYISQDNFLFNDSLGNNISVGNLNSTETEIQLASNKVNLNKITKQFNKELSLKVGDKGVNLSGGEKQRIALARAFLKDASILILDEAFSSLDSESEREILLSLKEKFTNSTILIISHRISTIKEVDEIIYINNGIVVEQGKHEELLSNKRHYWNLYKEQLELV